MYKQTLDCSLNTPGTDWFILWTMPERGTPQNGPCVPTDKRLSINLGAPSLGWDMCFSGDEIPGTVAEADTGLVFWAPFYWHVAPRTNWKSFSSFTTYGEESERDQVKKKKSKNPMKVSWGSLTYFLQEHLFQSPLFQRTSRYCTPPTGDSKIRAVWTPRWVQERLFFVRISAQCVYTIRNCRPIWARKCPASVLLGTCPGLFDSMIASHWKVKRSPFLCKLLAQICKVVWGS